jgi:hypothetical protein
VQIGSEVPLHLILPPKTTRRILQHYDYDLQRVSQNVHIVGNNKIVVLGHLTQPQESASKAALQLKQKLDK